MSQSLEHLISSLTLSEIRDVRSQLNKIEMKRDIIAALPIEIVSQIVHYFDLETFIKAYCCVSKEVGPLNAFRLHYLQD